MASAGSGPSTAEIDVYFEGSPMNSQFPSTATGTMHSASMPSTATGTSHASNTPSQLLFSPEPRPTNMVHPDVSHVDEAEIRNWTPNQVAHWLYIGGYDSSTIDKLIFNDISGDVLLSLQIDDLKELDILSFGKRRQLMGSIDHLRNTMRKPGQQDFQGQFESSDSDLSSSSTSRGRRSYKASVSPAGEVISSPDFGKNGNQPTQGEFVSIVGIEQLLPKPHSCSKGERCAKYQRRQRQLEKIMAENPGAVTLPGGAILTGNPGNPETAKNLLRPQSDSQPSVIASSNVFGSSQEAPRLSEQALSEVKKVDPQERMRSFLSYQHISSPVRDPEPPQTHYRQHSLPERPDRSAMSPAAQAQPSNPPPTYQLPHMAANLRNLPKLAIPTDYESDDLTTATAQRTITPSRGEMYGSPTTIQEHGPFSTAQNGAHIDNYRNGTPFTEVDVPITEIPNGPVARETSQSVPPDMRFGNLLAQRSQEPVMRASSTRPRMGTPLRRVHEDKTLTPIEGPADLERAPRVPNRSASTSTNPSLANDPNVTHSGWMKKRKAARLLREDLWENGFFSLRGTELAMHKDEANAHRESQALDMIDVNDYIVACSSIASDSKLSAAFKKTILRNNNPKDQSAFAFSLIPNAKDGEKKHMFINKNGKKNHHFAVMTRDERIEWVRNVLLARTCKAGRDDGSEMQVNGNFI